MNTFIYPATIEVDSAGFHLVTFPDIPEAGTDAETSEEALQEAPDALVAALGGYIEAKRPLPSPSEVKPNQFPIVLPILIAAKLALYDAMCEAEVTDVEFGKRLGISERAVRCLLDLDHRSHVGQVEAALAALGRRLVVEVHAA